jgi:hypothetical protein
VRKLLVLAVVIIVILAVGSAASRAVLNRANANADAPIFTSTYTLTSTKTDDLFVIADSAYLQADSRVEADASLIGKTSVLVDGQVTGDLTVMGGNITLGKEANISGDVVLIGNHVTISGRVAGSLEVIAQTLAIDESAQLSADTKLCATNMNIDNSNQTLGTRQCSRDEMAGWQSLRDGSLVTKALSGGNFSFASFAFTGLFALGLAALSGLIVTVFPRRFGQMTQAVRALPARASRIGCLTQGLTAALVAGLGVVIAILPPLGLVLLPILALMMLPLGILFAIGWMTMALLTGDWLLRRFMRRTSPPMLTVIAGSLGLFVIWTLLGILPFGPVLSFIMVLLIGAAGLGAVIMTRLGTRSAARSYFVQG